MKKLAVVFFSVAAYGVTMFSFIRAAEARDIKNYLWQLRAGLHNANNAHEREDDNFLLKVGETSCDYNAQVYDMDRFATELLIKLSPAITSSNDSAEEKMLKGEVNTHMLDFLRLSYWSANDWLCHDNNRR